MSQERKIISQISGWKRGDEDPHNSPSERTKYLNAFFKFKNMDVKWTPSTRKYTEKYLFFFTEEKTKAVHICEIPDTQKDPFEKILSALGIPYTIEKLDNKTVYVIDDSDLEAKIRKLNMYVIPHALFLIVCKSLLNMDTDIEPDSKITILPEAYIEPGNYPTDQKYQYTYDYPHSITRLPSIFIFRFPSSKMVEIKSDIEKLFSDSNLPPLKSPVLVNHWGRITDDAITIYANSLVFCIPSYEHLAYLTAVKPIDYAYAIEAARKNEVKEVSRNITQNSGLFMSDPVVAIIMNYDKEPHAVPCSVEEYIEQVLARFNYRKLVLNSVDLKKIQSMLAENLNLTQQNRNLP